MDFSKDHKPEHFIKVAQGVYLSKSDPRFLEKYLKYYPHDGEKIYEYAKLLEKQGRIRKAREYYQKAIKHGYLIAHQHIDNLNTKLVSDQNKNKDHERHSRVGMGVFFFAVFNFCLFSILFVSIGYWFFKYFLFDEPERVKQNDVTISSIDHIDKGITDHVMTEKKELTPPLIIRSLQNALQQYKEEKGSYPQTLTALIGKPPNNWLSFIPTHIEYQKNGRSYTINYNGHSYGPNRDMIKLIFYPQNNLLAVKSRGKLLASYPVASGKEELPFENSKVSQRVVNPNGGTGVLGTRGLVLHDQYAIHGTNKPDLLGGNITQGCLRMFNNDIEEIYPYIAKGTRFVVKNGALDTKPIYANGLPMLKNLYLDNEEQPQVHYQWKS